jgi:hypothetical protein
VPLSRFVEVPNPNLTIRTFCIAVGRAAAAAAARAAAAHVGDAAPAVPPAAAQPEQVARGGCRAARGAAVGGRARSEPGAAESAARVARPRGARAASPRHLRAHAQSASGAGLRQVPHTRWAGGSLAVGWRVSLSPVLRERQWAAWSCGDLPLPAARSGRRHLLSRVPEKDVWVALFPHAQLHAPLGGVPGGWLLVVELEPTSLSSTTLTVSPSQPTPVSLVQLTLHLAVGFRPPPVSSRRRLSQHRVTYTTRD